MTISRNTSTGAVLEQTVLPALTRGGYSAVMQVNVGIRPGGRKHVVDVEARDATGKTWIVSMKWQQTSGTAEQKVPFEVICLAEAVRLSEGRYEAAYLVLGGTGWTLRDFYVQGGLKPYLTLGHLVHVITLEQFLALANMGRL